MKRIQKAKIKFISLCPRGKNALPVLYKADGTVEFDTVTKASEDIGELTAVVYAPENPDKDQHVASPEVIRDMAHTFQKEGGQIDIRHDGRAVERDRAYVAESFIVQKGDERFADLKDYDGNPVDAAGAWATVIRIDDPDLRQLYRDGKWNGVSMAGTGLLSVEKESADEEPPGWFTKALRALGLGGVSQDVNEDIEMKKEELEALLKESNAALVGELAKALKPETEEVTKGDDNDPEVDLNDPAALKARAAELEKERAVKDLDLSDPAALRAYADSLEKGDDDDAGEGEPEDVAKEGDSDEVAELKAKLRKAQARSNQAGGAEENYVPEGLTKEDVDAIDIGRRMAEHLNKQRGFTA